MSQTETLEAFEGGRSALAAKVERSIGPGRLNLGMGFVAAAAAIVVVVRALYSIGWFIGLWPRYPQPLLALGAWALLTVVIATEIIASRLAGDRMPTRLFLLIVGLLAVVVSLDLAAIWPLHDVGRNATAALTATMSLIVLVTQRPIRDLLAATGLLSAGIAVAMLLGTAGRQHDIAPQITALAFATLPAVIATVVVRAFRRMVQIELDRALVQSTVSTPGFAVGMLASEELARLDLAAEDLLDSVAQGRTPLPLDATTASLAASLATELRLHLIEGRRQTWLYHAVSESELLGQVVTVDDSAGLAALLDPGQRDGLLGGIWALVSDAARPVESLALAVTIGPVAAARAPEPHTLTVPIVIEADGVSRNRVDPSTWDALRRVGRYSDSVQSSHLRVQIECLVANPAGV
ncbi:MAG: hypothetical protein QM635_03415 [Microbacteriaceae bacterium]